MNTVEKDDKAIDVEDSDEKYVQPKESQNTNETKRSYKSVGSNKLRYFSLKVMQIIKRYGHAT